MLGRQQEATLRSEFPRQAKFPGFHPTCARRHRQPAPMLPAPGSLRRSDQPRPPPATERQRPQPPANPQPRTKFSRQRDRPGEKAKLSQLGSGAAN